MTRGTDTTTAATGAPATGTTGAGADTPWLSGPWEGVADEIDAQRPAGDR